jgi:hypothetical protein
VHADHVLGRFRPAARLVIDSDEVLLARMQSAAQGFELAAQRLFDRQVFDDGFDDQAHRPALEGFDRLQAGADGFALGGWQLAFSTSRPSCRSMPSTAWAAAPGGCRRANRVAGLGRDLGDPGAHGAGTDHRHQRVASSAPCSAPLERGVRLFMKALTPSR